jgi:hypothetical protein
MADDFGFDFGNFDLGFDPSLSFPDFNFDFPDFSLQDFNFDFPTFDPGQFDLGFDPSFDLGQFSPSIGDPFAIPTGDLSLPDFDLSGFLAQDPSFGLGDFQPSLNSFGNFNFTPTSFGSVPELPPDLLGLQDMGLNNLSGGLGSNVGALPALPGLGGGPLPGLPATPGGAPAATSSDSTLKNAQADYYKWAPLLGLGQLGLGLGGGLMQALGPQPKPQGPSDIERAKIQSDIDATRSREQLDRDALAQQMEIARMQMEASGGNAELQSDTAKAIAEMNKRKPLFGTDPRFSTLYDETVGDQQNLSPNDPEIQAMTQQIYSVRQQAATEQYAKQRDAILERSNRLGTNPAAELAQINEAEQQAKQAMLVEAQQVALAFAQSRLDPSEKLLQAILGTVV